MESQEDLPQHLQFVRLLWQLDHALNKGSRRLLRTVGVTAPQRFIIKVVGMRPGCSPGELARFMHVTPATVTRVVQRMEEAGYLRRAPDPDDSRRVKLHLTAKGRRVEGRAAAPSESPISQALARLPADRITVAMEVLEAVVASLEAQGGQGA